MSKITATIITLNEEERVGACLESLRDIADEIIVIDSYSTDATVEICERYGAIVRRRKFAGYGAQRQYATSLASHPYVLAIDADEVLSPALRASLLRLKEEGFTHRVYSFSRLNFYCGEPIRHCGWYPDRQIRLFDKRYANWNLRDVQERVIFRDTVRPELVDGDILHYRCSTPEQYSTTQRRHARIRSRVIAANTDKVSAVRPLLAGIAEFVNCYIMQGGILDGREGRAISTQRFRSAVLSHSLARRLLKRSRAALTALLICLPMLMMQSCIPTYKFNGSAIDYTVYKTVHVSEFPIRAALVYPPLQQMFENALLDYITRNTRLQTTDGASDLEISGEITGYSLTPQAVTENAYASKTRLTIQVRLKYTDNKQDNKDVDQTFSAYRDFDSSELLTDVQDQLCEEISKELVELIFNATLGDW